MSTLEKALNRLLWKIPKPPGCQNSEDVAGWIIAEIEQVTGVGTLRWDVPRQEIKIVPAYEVPWPEAARFSKTPLFATHRVGDRVQHNTALIGEPPLFAYGIIQSIDRFGCATVRLDDGAIIHQDICALLLVARPVPTDADLHHRGAHPDFEYETTKGPRKNFDEHAPNGEGWERNVDMGRNGWERFEYHEEAYWRRHKRISPLPS